MSEMLQFNLFHNINTTITVTTVNSIRKYIFTLILRNSFVILLHVVINVNDKNNWFDVYYRCNLVQEHDVNNESQQ